MKKTISSKNLDLGKLEDYLKWIAEGGINDGTLGIKQDDMFQEIAFQNRFKEERLTCKFTRKPFPFVETLTKMQVCFVNEAKVEDKIAWNKSMGYPHCHVIKLIEGNT